MAVITALDLLVAAQILDLTCQVEVAAALVPSLGWTLFATALNANVSDLAKAS